MNSVENWQVCICEVSCPAPMLRTGMPLISVGNTHKLEYCNMISAPFLGNGIVGCLRMFIFPSTNCDNIFLKIYYVPVEQRNFQEIRIDFLKTNGKRVPFKDCKIPTKVVLHFLKNSHWSSVINHDVSTVTESFTNESFRTVLT